VNDKVSDCGLIVAMSMKHQTILRRKRPQLLRSIILDELLLSKLQSDFILTRAAKEEIMVCNSDVVILLVGNVFMAGGADLNVVCATSNYTVVIMEQISAMQFVYAEVVFKHKPCVLRAMIYLWWQSQEIISGERFVSTCLHCFGKDFFC